jgi:hypothetical protein
MTDYSRRTCRHTTLIPTQTALNPAQNEWKNS